MVSILDRLDMLIAAGVPYETARDLVRGFEADIEAAVLRGAMAASKSGPAAEKIAARRAADRKRKQAAKNSGGNSAGKGGNSAENCGNQRNSAAPESPVPSVSPTPPSTTLSPDTLLRPLKGAHGSRDDDDLFRMLGDPGPDPDDRGTGPMLTAIPKAKRHKGLNGHAVDFERWYAAYPKHVDRGAAEKAYLKAITLATPDQLVAGAEAYAAHIAAKPPDERRFTKNPATWLNAKGWLDERPVCELTTGGHDGRPEQLGPAAQRRLDNFRRGLAAPGVLAARRTSG